MEEGLDSLSAVELGNALQDTVGIPMPATLVFDYPSATAIVTYIQSAALEAPCVVDVSDDKKRGTWLEPCPTKDNHGSSSDKECPASFRKVLGYDARRRWTLMVMLQLRPLLQSMLGATSVGSDFLGEPMRSPQPAAMLLTEGRHLLHVADMSLWIGQDAISLRGRRLQTSARQIDLSLMPSTRSIQHRSFHDLARLWKVSKCLRRLCFGSQRQRWKPWTPSKDVYSRPSSSQMRGAVFMTTQPFVRHISPWLTSVFLLAHGSRTMPLKT